MDRLRKLFTKKPEPPAEIAEPVLQRRRKKRPAPAPPVPNTPQLPVTMQPVSSYNPPSDGNLFAGYSYPENFLNPWTDIKTPQPQPKKPDASQPLADPVAESKRAWAQYDRQVRYDSLQ